MAQSSSDSSQAEYSLKATVAAITSYYELLARVHPDSVCSLEYPPSGGWPQITSESFCILGRNDTVIELMRHIPGGGVPITSSMFTLAVLAEEKEEGYDVLLETEHNIVTAPIPPDAEHIKWGGGDEDEAEDEKDDGSNGEDSEDSEEDVDIYTLGHNWRYSPTYRINTFFNMCLEQWKVMNWMPKMEWAGQIGKRYRSAETELDETYGDGLRQKIMREAGWPGTGEEVGLGWDKAKAEKQMIELM
ncbi:hypothetical protein CSPX01_09812 [Colletotrichum filicis]|nr:hypothetical protein CSPX01_09812 [Colletotrichum filicis]